MKRDGYITKLAYLSGLIKQMDLYTIGIRTRNKYKRVVLIALSSLFIVCGFFIKIFGRIRLSCLEQDNYKYRLAITAIAKNEGDYIEEWVAYYKVIGVDCIFLYDNESDDGIKDKIQKYIDEGFVIYHLIEGSAKQRAAYDDALRQYGKKCKYMGFFDIDEFLMSSNPSDSVIDIIDDIFKNDKNVGGLGINWYMYGSSGLTKKTDGLVMERFVCRAGFDSVRNRSIKSIVNPLCVKCINHPHFADLHRGYYNTGLKGELIGNYLNPISEESIMRVNHYYTKSREEWNKRRTLEEADYGGPKRFVAFESVDENDVKDETALYYLDKVKETMAQYRNTN